MKLFSLPLFFSLSFKVSEIDWTIYDVDVKLHEVFLCCWYSVFYSMIFCFLFITLFYIILKQKASRKYLDITIKIEEGPIISSLFWLLKYLSN